MKSKLSSIGKSFFWCFLILLFPVTSGTISVITGLNTVETLFLQGIFMMLALVPPAIMVLSGKWKLEEIGFAPFHTQRCRCAFYFIPVLVIFIPAAIKGFHVQSITYCMGSAFLYLFVGISEEIYFRGIIPKYLKAAFSPKGVILLSTAIFAIGHLATAFAGSSLFQTALSILNAFLFGWMAIEITMLSKNILPVILIHFFFDFETKIVVLSGSSLLIAECLRGTLMFIIAIWLSCVINKEKCCK